MRAWRWSNRPPNISTAQGRVEAKKLSRLAATLYAAESMRLTTRLMQIASWLLLQRAANSGEMTPRPGRDRRSPRCGSTRPRRMPTRPAGRELPKPFVDLVNRSLSLQALVRRMDDEIYGENAVVAVAGAAQPNPGLRPDHAAEHRLRARLTRRASAASRISPETDAAALFLLCSHFAGIAVAER